MKLILLALLACAPAARAYETIRFLEPLKAQDLSAPTAVAASRDEIFALDGKSNRLFTFDKGGTPLAVTGPIFRGPRGLAAGPDGSIFVADTGNHRIAVLNRQGVLLHTIGKKGSGSAELRSPESVAVSWKGTVYVADTGNHRVQAYSREGVFLFGIGVGGRSNEPGRFNGPTRVRTDSAGDLFVLDRGNARIQKLDQVGAFIREFAMLGDDMAVNAQGLLYDLDRRAAKVIERDRLGAILGKFGSSGSGVGQFSAPEGLSMAPDGTLLVADTGNGRIQRIELNQKQSAAPLAPVARAAPAEPAAPAVPPPAPPEPGIDELPAPARPNPNAHALVIGIERYREALPKADFAAADARLAAEYFRRVLGVPEENLALLIDDKATKGDFEKFIERWLPNRVEEGGEVFVYFSGHGAPDPAAGDAYLVPYDGDPTYIKETGYSMKRLYGRLAKLPAKRVVVAMDSCFSGAGGRSVIAAGARPLVAVQQDAPPQGLTILSASASNQISNSYREKGHGLFTYYLLKGLKEKGADFKAVYDFLRPQVARTARRQYNADQDPQWLQSTK